MMPKISQTLECAFKYMFPIQYLKSDVIFSISKTFDRITFRLNDVLIETISISPIN